MQAITVLVVHVLVPVSFIHRYSFVLMKNSSSKTWVPFLWAGAFVLSDNFSPSVFCIASFPSGNVQELQIWQKIVGQSNNWHFSGPCGLALASCSLHTLLCAVLWFKHHYYKTSGIKQMGNRERGDFCLLATEFKKALCKQVTLVLKLCF